MFGSPGSQRKIKHRNFNFLLTSLGNKKPQDNHILYYGTTSFQEVFIKSIKCTLLGNITIMPLKIKTASVQTGVGKHRERKGRINILICHDEFL